MIKERPYSFGVLYGLFCIFRRMHFQDGFSFAANLHKIFPFVVKLYKNGFF